MKKAIRNKVFYISTVAGYMMAGWYCAKGANWAWIILILVFATLSHATSVFFEVDRAVDETLAKAKEIVERVIDQLMKVD